MITVDQPQLIQPLRMEIMEILRAGGPYINPLLVDEFIPNYMEIMGVDRPDRTYEHL